MTVIGYVIVLVSYSQSPSDLLSLGYDLATIGTFFLAVYIIAIAAIEEFSVSRSRRRQSRGLLVAGVFSILLAIVLLIPFGAGVLPSSILVLSIALAFHFYSYDRRWALATAITVVIVFSSCTAAYAYTASTTGSLLQQTQVEMIIKNISSFSIPNDNITVVSFNVTYLNPSGDSVPTFQVTNINFYINGSLLYQGSYDGGIGLNEISLAPHANVTDNLCDVWLYQKETNVAGRSFAAMWPQIVAGNFTLSMSCTFVLTVGGFPYLLSAIFPPIIATRSVSISPS